MRVSFLKDDIRWVITVPAIWRQEAKQFMREAAYQVKSQFIGLKMKYIGLKIQRYFMF